MRNKDFNLGVGLLAVCAIFFYMITKLPKQASVYPMFVTTILAVLSLIFTVKAYINRAKEEKGLLDGVFVKQLLAVSGACLVYVGLIKTLGYFTSTLLYFIVVLLGFKLNKKIVIGVSIGFCLFIFVLFKVMLKVPLPKGFLA